MTHVSPIFRLSRLVRAFRRAEQGNVAVLFALTLLPVIGFAGAAVDYSRLNNARTAMQAALDSTALMLSKDAASLTQAQLTAKATAYFTAMYNHPEATGVNVNALYTPSSGSGSKIYLTGKGTVATAFMKVLGKTQMPFTAETTANWGAARLRVALALDVTGSMSSDGKMTALKPAAKSLIDQLQALAKVPGDVYISIVPFSKDVNVGATNYSANWLKWTDWDTANTVAGSCSQSKWKTQSDCVAAKKVWTPGGVANHNTWNGCITDRDKDYDIKNTSPSPGTPGSLFWPEQYSSCPVSLMPLSYDWTSLKAKVDALQPAGNTNQPIGLAWAWQTLSSGPFTYPAEDTSYQYSKVIVLMSDGMNTENRWSTSQSTIDARQALQCTNVKNAGVILYTIQVNTGGDPLSTVLRNCASSLDKFYIVSSAGGMATVFTEIGNKLSKLRLSQ